MTFEKRNLLDVIFIPAGILAFAALSWWAIYAGPDRADKIEARRQSDVASVLVAYPWAEADVQGQSAVLSGVAPTRESRNRALRAVSSASGRGGWFWGGIRKVEDNTVLAKPVDNFYFEARMDGGVIHLSGFLPDTDARDRLIDRINREGFWGDEIVDDTKLAEGMPEGDWLGAADLGLSQFVRLSNAHLMLDKKHLLLTGEAPNAAVKIQVSQRMLRPPSGYTADVDLSGTAVWSARIDNDRLTLSGSVPDAAIRTELTELASRFFGGEIVNSQIIRPMSETGWISGVRTALPNFLQFRHGEMAFMGRELVIEGAASQSIIDFMREDIVRAGALVEFELRAEPVSANLSAFEELHPGQAADAEMCEAALIESLSLGSLVFRRGDEALKRESAPVLDGVEAVLRKCPEQVLAVAAYTRVNGTNVSGTSLAKARQQAVADYFIARGIPLNQISLTELIAGQSAPSDPPGEQNDSQIRLRFEE